MKNKQFEWADMFINLSELQKKSCRFELKYVLWPKYSVYKKYFAGVLYL